MFHAKKEKKLLIGIIAKELLVALKLFIFLIALFFTFHASAQCISCVGQDTTGAPSVLNPARNPVPYPFVREADVMWSKRIWRTIDLREKLNHPLYYPENPHDGLRSLFDLIKCGLLNGCITAFDNPAFDDEFKVKMSAEQVANLLVQKDSMQVEDVDNQGSYIYTPIINEINSRDIMAYWIKEDWFFDRQRSVMDVRIIGICPLTTKNDPTTGEVLGYKPLFWLYFPQLRPLLMKQGVYLGKNYTARISYDDLFRQRYFNSYIYKESNVYDRPINSYSTGIDALLEGEAIKDEISNFESDLWHY